MTYRPDIDGLRAIAVLLVVLYHASVPGFAGGFVGVDVFFVISGYLITQIIHGEMQAGTFSFPRFYERRARRLFPALFVVLAVCITVGWFTTIPSDFARMAEAALATLFFVSNFYFWGQTGYFDAGVANSYLLHTWSLGVEEQFYLLYPLLMLALFRYAPGRIGAVLAAFALVSWAACIAMTADDATTAFYVTPYRMWELLIGALLALYAAHAAPARAVSLCCGIAGLALILYAGMRFDAATAFPGFAATLPAVGAGLMIFAGRDADSPVTRAMSYGPLVYVGLISYSLYLWHRPVLVFFDALLGTLGPLTIAVAIVLSIALSALSHRYIERPFRDRTRTPRPTRLAVLAGTAIVVAGVAIALNAGVPARMPEPVRLADQTELGRNPLADACGTRRTTVATGECLIGPPGEPTWVVWGDSHALVLSPAIEAATGQPGQLLTHSACAPLLGVWRAKDVKALCAQFNGSVLGYLESTPAITTVYLVARWALNVEGTRYGDETGDGPVLVSDGPDTGNLKLFQDRLEATVAGLKAAGKDIVLVSQVPEVAFDVPRILARARLHGEPDPTGPSRTAYLERNRRVLDAFAALAQRHPAVRVIHPYETLCADDTCRIQAESASLYYDNHHLTVEGARLLAPLFSPVLTVRQGDS